MTNQPKFLLRLSVACLLSLAIVSCNNDADKKDSDDSAALIPVQPLPTVDSTMMPIDTTKMDSASTRPVKTTN